MRYVFLMTLLGISLIALLAMLTFRWGPILKQQLTPTPTTTPQMQLPTTIRAFVEVSEALVRPQSSVAVPETTQAPVQTPQIAPVQAPVPTIIIVPTSTTPIMTPTNPEPSSTPSTTTPLIPTPSPAPVSPTPAPEVVVTAEELKPVITLNGTREGDNVTFTWAATGLEPLECKANGKIVSQEGTITVVSPEPYTLTMVCVGTRSASRTQESLTK